MTTTPSDVQSVINTINELSSLVGRYVFDHAPEEADDAQRAGFEAIRKLTRLKDELPAPSAVNNTEESPATKQEAA